MSTIPSLALLPSGYKASKVYSVLPTDGTGDFTFARAGAATRVNSEGLIEEVLSNVPRLNYPMIDGVVSGCTSLLLEPQRTNIALRSQELATSPWILAGGAVTNNSAISPDGTLNASKIESVSGNVGGVYQTLTSLVTGDIYTVSFYGKSGTSANLCLTINNTAAWNTVGGKVFTSADGLNNSTWTRFEYTFAVPSTSGFNIHIGSHSEVGLTSQYLGDFYVYGVQAEKSSYPTSYIPTTSSAVTRVAETANGAGDASTFNDSEGVLFAEISALANTVSAYNSIGVGSGDAFNRIGLGFQPNDTIYVYKHDGTLSWLPSKVIDIKSFNKVALSYKTNDNYFWVNGFKISSDSNVGNLSVQPNSMGFLAPFGAEQFYGNTKQIQYFDSALNDTDLETLTSWTSFSEMATSQLYSVE